MRATGPARGSHVRLPVGMLARGGRNIFSSAKIGASSINQRRFPSPVRSESHSRSRSRSPVSSAKPWLRRSSRRASLSHSESRSKSSDSHRSSASSSGSRSRPVRRRRTRSRSSPRSGHKVSYSSSRVSRRCEELMILLELI